MGPPLDPPLYATKQRYRKHSSVEGVSNIVLCLRVWKPGPVLAGARPNWEQFRSAQVPSQPEPRYVDLGAGPNWEQFRSAQVPSQPAPRSVELGAGPNWDQLVQLAKGRPWQPVYYST